MPDIYRSAHRVRAWLGAVPYATGDLFQRLIKKAVTREVLSVTRDWTTAEIRTLWADFLKLLHPHESLEDVYLAMLALEAKPYWTRKWIIQEAVLAQRLTLYIGDFLIDLSHHSLKPPGFWKGCWRDLYMYLRELVMARVRMGENGYDGLEDVPLDLQDRILRLFTRFDPKLAPLSAASGEANSDAVSSAIGETNPKEELNLWAILLSRQTICTGPRDCVFALLGCGGRESTSDFVPRVMS